MNAQFFHFLAVTRAAVDEKVVHLGLWFFGLRTVNAGMNGRPAEYSLYSALASLDPYALAGRDLVVYAAISFQVQQALGVDIIYEPADLIGMCLDHDFERSIGIDDTYTRTIRVPKGGLNIGLQV